MVRNGVDLARFRPMPKDPELVKRYGLDRKFVAGYVGTHGMAHALETLLDAAVRMRTETCLFSTGPSSSSENRAGASSNSVPDPSPFFLFLGDGARKQELMTEARRRGLDNVLFLNSVPKEKVVRYWSLLDVSIIHLRKTELFTTVIPSKLFESMGMGIPVLLGVAGESAEIVEKEGVELTFEPDVNLGEGSASHAVQTAEIMRAFEPFVLAEKPDGVLMVGDVNSTIACGLVAVKLGMKLIHVEAGLRSYDRSMPEEISRLLTNAISDLLFCSEPSGVENLKREGVAEEKIRFVGNVMIDTLLKNREKAERSMILDELGMNERPYAVVTLHRPSNVDDPARILEAWRGILKDGDMSASQTPPLWDGHAASRIAECIIGKWG